MTHCSSENQFPAAGFEWTAPDPLPLRIESDRLLLRTYTLDDVEEVYRVVNETREHLIPWLPWCRAGYTDIDASTHEIATFIMELRKPMELSRVIFGVFLKDTGELIGGSGIHDIRRDTASCETGYWISKSHTRMGYGEEACRRTISWAMQDQLKGGMGLRRVRIYCSGENKASTRLIEKLAIRAEVIQRDDYYVEGVGCTDRLGWGVLRSEWDCDRHRAIGAEQR
ncbi:MAG: GNAT family N-acetyltransferase [bacterium]|nr:GNAT family N-acetyltransferase [bacterium]